MGPKERRQRERDLTRTQILDAARELFVSEGYEGVSMRRIADRIEYSLTAIYFHFRDKDALIRELCDHDFLALAKQFAAAGQLANPLDRLRATGLAYVRFGLDFPNHYRLMFMTPHPTRIDETGLAVGNPEEDAWAFLKSIVADAIAQGLLKPEHNDVELVSQTAWAAVHGVISLHIAKRNDDWVAWADINRRAETMVDVLIDGIRKKS